MFCDYPIYGNFVSSPFIRYRDYFKVLIVKSDEMVNKPSLQNNIKYLLTVSPMGVIAYYIPVNNTKQIPRMQKDSETKYDCHVLLSEL